MILFYSSVVDSITKTIEGYFSGLIVEFPRNGDSFFFRKKTNVRPRTIHNWYDWGTRGSARTLWRKFRSQLSTSSIKWLFTVKPDTDDKKWKPRGALKMQSSSTSWYSRTNYQSKVYLVVVDKINVFTLSCCHCCFQDIRKSAHFRSLF